MAVARPRPYYRRTDYNAFKPQKHNHVGDMIYDDDYCVCRSCEQSWKLTERGWKPLPPEPRKHDGYDFYS